MSDAVERPGASRVRGGVLALVALAAGLTLLASSQVWIELRVADGSWPVDGGTAAPAGFAFGIVGLAVLAATLLAGPVFRIVFGVLQVVVGACIVLGASLVIADPIAASTSVITQHSGLTGAGAVAAVDAVALTVWPAVQIGAGVLTALTGILIVATARRWPVSGRKYRIRTEGETDLLDWDAVSREADAAPVGSIEDPQADDDPVPGTGATAPDEPDADPRPKRSTT